ncbi:hypothetical protein E2C01_065169 [Portunus trituberculatus]|uniref:Uncharacterized protein n=1 Tax=Portunus trituberculatus TaxID=210409 RepID=A0A5B7HNW1_PORTR|nr:hypothetical protein [Portunus trituberculatus]
MAELNPVPDTTTTITTTTTSTATTTTSSSTTFPNKTKAPTPHYMATPERLAARGHSVLHLDALTPDPHPSCVLLASPSIRLLIAPSL